MDICYQIKNYGYIMLNKITYVAKSKESDSMLTVYHYVGDSEYEKNPTPYRVDVTLDNEKDYVFRYASEKERDAVFTDLINAINEYHRQPVLVRN